MTALSDKITKLESLLEQVPKGTPTYETIKQSLKELYAERDKASAEPSTKMSEQSLKTPSPPSTETTEPSPERPVNESMFQAIGIIKGQIETELVSDILPTLMLTHRARASQRLQLLLRTLTEL